MLEQGTTELLEQVGCGERMHAEGMVHLGFDLAFDGQRHRIDLQEMSGGKTVMVYGQTEVTKDLINRRSETDGITIYEAQNVQPHDFNTDQPWVSYQKDGVEHRVDSDFIVGCDGFHGISRAPFQTGRFRFMRRSIQLVGWEFWRMFHPFHMS